MIECTRYQKYEGGKSSHLLGFADIYDSEIDADIYGVRLFQKDGKRWVSLPGREYEKDMDKKFAPFMRFRDKEKWAALIDGAKNAIEEFCATQQARKVFEADTPF